MNVETFYDTATATFTYVIVDEATSKCAVIDSVLDYDAFSGKSSTVNADKVIEFIKSNNLQNEWILETHVHADHISAAHYLKSNVGGKIGIGSGIKAVLATWLPVFEMCDDTPSDGSQFDELFEEGDTFNIGDLNVTVWHTPGHTPACASFLVDNSIFVGDTMFAPHLGTARCDFPGGSAKDLYNTIQRFFTLSDDTKVYLGHDYPKEGSSPLSCISIAQAKSENVQVSPSVTMQEYITKREKRDATLAVPKLLLPAIQCNLRNGQFLKSEQTGKPFIRVPVNSI